MTSVRWVCGPCHHLRGGNLFTCIQGHSGNTCHVRFEAYNDIPAHPKVNPMDINELPDHAQAIVEHLAYAGFDQDPTMATNRQVLCLAEEVGEFVGAYRRYTGQARRTGTLDEVYSELADVVIVAYVTAAEMGINLNTQIAKKLETIYTRGWRE